MSKYETFGGYPQRSLLSEQRRVARNPAYNIATKVLESDFCKIDDDGPIRAAQFLGRRKDGD